MPEILVVEDDPYQAEALTIFLRKSGYDVVAASDGRAALNRVIERRPDLVMLDLFLPEMNGIELLEVLSSYMRLKTLPVIVWTGAMDLPLLDRARNLNANAVLVKSRSTYNHLLVAIQKALPKQADKGEDERPDGE
jgi:CheY-like chemotaxis protein